VSGIHRFGAGKLHAVAYWPNSSVTMSLCVYLIHIAGYGAWQGAREAGMSTWAPPPCKLVIVQTWVSLHSYACKPVTHGCVPVAHRGWAMQVCNSNQNKLSSQLMLEAEECGNKVCILISAHGVPHFSRLPTGSRTVPTCPQAPVTWCSAESRGAGSGDRGLDDGGL